MEKLSYLTTFVALIYGLGIANVLAHLSLLLKRGAMQTGTGCTPYGRCT
jgi:hypothetical protein